MRGFRVVGVLALAVMACPWWAAPTDGASAKTLRGDVERLADPKWEGRGAGTKGQELAAEYLASRMRAIGVQPGGDEGTYYQSMEVTTGVEVQEPCAVEVGGASFPVGEGMQPIGFSTNGTLEAPVVFAGYGITAPGLDYDDYAGLDVRDKLVLLLTNEPQEMDSTSRFDGTVNTPHADLRTKAINAREHGALGMLVVNGPAHHAGEPLRKPKADGSGYMTSGLLAVQISEAAAAALLRSANTTLAALQQAIDSHGKPHGLALPESATVTVTLRRAKADIRNVVGWIPGRDTTRTLVIGAHYDHLGYGGESSLSPDERAPHVGADDNASGVSAMLWLAEHLASKGSRSKGAPVHNLVFCAFTGEEMGLVGSGHYVGQPTRPIESIEAMLNMDMVGRLRDNRLLVMGTGTAAEFADLVPRINQATEKFDLKTSNDGFGPSDHSSFYKKKVPVLMLFTGAHADYHKPSDTAEKINYEGLAKIARFASAIVDSLDARPKPTYVVAKADSTMGRIAGGGGYGAYLGTIPDYLQTEGGVLLSGVRTGSPADQAALKGGDVIVKFDGVRIDNIYDYTFALRSRKPGQAVRITVKRGADEMDLVATLGRRP